MKVSVLSKAVVVAVLAVSAASSSSAVKPTPAESAAMREFWRHAPKYGCLACSVYVPAPKAASVPRNIGALPVLQARLYDSKARLGCFCAEGRYIWAADDSAVYQIDARKQALVRTFTVSNGLPDVPVRQLLADGPWLWIVGRGRLARVKIADGKVQTPAQPTFCLARLAVGPAGTFLVTEQGAYRWNASSRTFKSLGAYPGQVRVAQATKRGFWQFQWARHWSSLLRGVAVGRKEFYVLAGNTLSRFSTSTGWSVLAKDAWRIVLDEPYLWATTTTGVLWYDSRSAKVERFTAARRDLPKSGRGLAPGRPIELTIARPGGSSTGGVVCLLSEPRFDRRAKKFSGGGVSRFDTGTGKWLTTKRIGDTDVSFTTTAAAHNGDLFVAVQLVGAVEHRSLHPGMMSTRRYLPRITGLAIAVKPKSRPWRLLRQKLAGESRWVMGQGKNHRRETIRPQRISRMLVSNGRMWATLENFPEKYYGGYYPSVQCIARKTKSGWHAVEDRSRLESLGLVGEQPGVLCLTATHGSPIVLGHGHRRMLGLLSCGGTVWVVHEGGLYTYDQSKDSFRPVLTEPFRAYWQVTAAASGPSGVWFGTDAGTVTRYDRRSGRFRLLGVIPGRKITQIRTAADKVWVRTAPAKVTLPAALLNLPKLPTAQVIHYDGRAWSASSDGRMPKAPALHFQFQKGNYLHGPAGDTGRPAPLGYLKGVFQPKVLCAEGPDTFWVTVWGGVGRLCLGKNTGKEK